MTRPPWPPAAVALLRRLWPGGKICAKIAEAIGKQTGFWPSAHAISSKVHRLGLPGRPPPIKATRLPKAPSGLSRVKLPAQRPQAAAERDKRADLPAKPAPAQQAVTRPGSACAWPTSPDRPWRFCGEPCEEGSSYCFTHRARAYQAGTASGWQRSGTQDANVRTVKSRTAWQRSDSKWSL